MEHSFGQVVRIHHDDDDGQAVVVQLYCKCMMMYPAEYINTYSLRREWFTGEYRRLTASEIRKLKAKHINCTKECHGSQESSCSIG
jgi:hypothetical protein